jgi:hypothetical protein
MGCNSVTRSKSGRLMLLSIFVVLTMLLAPLQASGSSASTTSIHVSGIIENKNPPFSNYGFIVPLPFLHETDESFVPNLSSNPSSWSLLSEFKPKEILLMTWGRNVFNMFAIGPDQVITNLANYIDDYKSRGYRLIIPTGEDGFMMKELEYDLDAPISNGINNKRIIDILAGDNYLHRNFLTDPTMDHLTIFREDNLSQPNYERRAIELMDYIRSNGGKVCYHNPRWGENWSIEAGSRDRISNFNTHEDYFVMNFYRVWDVVNKDLTEGKPENIYNDTYNSYIFALNFLKSKAGQIPLSNIGAEEDGMWHGKLAGYPDVDPKYQAEAERAIIEAFKDSGCGTLFKFSFFDMDAVALGIVATNLSGINDPEWKLPPGEFYPSAEIWRQAFANF